MALSLSWGILAVNKNSIPKNRGKGKTVEPKQQITQQDQFFSSKKVHEH